MRESLKNELKIEKERRVRFEDKVKYRLSSYANCVQYLDNYLYFIILQQCRTAEAEVRKIQLSSEKLKSSLSHKVETKNKSIVELETVVNELRMANKQLNNKVTVPNISTSSVLAYYSVT